MFGGVVVDEAADGKKQFRHFGLKGVFRNLCPGVGGVETVVE